MFIERIEALSEEAVLQANREQALANLESALKNPQEVMLRQHQISMLQTLYHFIASGETAGYMSEPTGSGKSAVIVKTAEATGLKTLILSPTQQILGQIYKDASRFTPGLRITNYFAHERDLSGQAINTTYQSVLSLLRGDGNGKTKGFNPADIQLVLCDEAHLALGEIRHTIHRQFPHALMIAFTATPEFSPLAGFIDREIVDENERWVGMFKNLIHEMTLEEAMESGILSPVNIHMIKTNVVVPDINVLSNKEYRQSDLERLFATQSRNALAVAMIAGVDKLPADINLADTQKAAIREVHQKITGKRTVIFGISIAHVNELALKLRSLGLSAAAVHGDIPHGERSRILDAHLRGEIQIILGVDLLRLGWDSPSTEVGIYLRPTCSGVVKTQELGRILRPSPQTGKGEAMAVEIVDEMVKKWQSPIVFANIFDPEYILRGAQTGKIPWQGQVSPREKPIITISGMNLGVIIEEARMQELLRIRFKQASVLEISNLLDVFTEEIQQRYPRIGVYQWAQMMVEKLPGKIPAEAQQTVLQALASVDLNTREAGKKAFFLLNLKTILTVVDSYTSDTYPSEEKDELVSEAVASVMERLSKIRANQSITRQIYDQVKDALTRHATTANVVDTVDIDEVEVVDKTDVEKEVFDPITAEIHRERIAEILQSLTGRERRVLELRFGFPDEEAQTLEQVGNVFGVTRERIRQIEAKALRKLKHPAQSNQLRDLLEENEETGIITFWPDQGREFGRIWTEKDLWVKRARLTDSLQQIEDKVDINLMNLTVEERETLADFGIRQLGEFFSAPPEEIFAERSEVLISAAWKILHGKLTDLYLAAKDAKPPSHAALIAHVAEAAVYQNSDWDYQDLTLWEIHALITRSTELITPATQQKIFIKVYERLESFLKKL